MFKNTSDIDEVDINMIKDTTRKNFSSRNMSGFTSLSFKSPVSRSNQSFGGDSILFNNSSSFKQQS